MNTINARMSSALRSRRGASLSMALLLFLVCAVVGGVVLAAASAAAGRAANLGGDAEQKYYAVTSAVALLEKELDGKSVEITRTRAVKKQTVVTTTVIWETIYKPIKDEDGNIIDYDEIQQPKTLPKETVIKYGAEYTTTASQEGLVVKNMIREIGYDYSTISALDAASNLVEGEEDKCVIQVTNTGSSGSLDFLTELALKLLFGADSDGNIVCNTKNAWDASFGSGGYREGTIDIPVSSVGMSNDALDALHVTGTWKMMSNGNIVFTLWNANGGSDSDSYALQLVMKAEELATNTPAPTSTTPSTVVSTPSPTGSEISKKVETTVQTNTQTKTYRITWSVQSVAGVEVPSPTPTPATGP